MAFYHDGMRELQDRYEGRAVADRLEQHRMHTTFTEADRALIESVPFFFLATAWDDSVDCSFKGGMPGFVRVTGPSELQFPDYDGNRMYRSLGNILRNPRVGLLFLRFDGQRFDGSAARLRINGRAYIDERPEARAGLPGAKRVVRVVADRIFPNCPRYIPRMELVEPSIYAPREGHTPPEPEWKSRPYIREALEQEPR
jgi:uncharacterized protein